MNNSMINSSVSMHSLQQKLDILSNNIANLNTTGFKKKDASFEDVLTNVKSQPEGFRQQGRFSPLGFNQGWGSKLVQIQTNLAQGPIQSTGGITDFAIQGDGLFEVSVSKVDGNGNQVFQPAWTRNGSFNLTPDANGDTVLTTKEGHFVTGTDGNPIRIPAGFRPVVQPNGIINGYSELDPTAEPLNLGQIKLVRVVRPQLLQDVGDNLYALPTGITEAEKANILQNVDPGLDTTNNRVTLMQGFLEQSNVTLSDEMTDLVMVQRALQLNSRAITSADQMMNIANNLRA
ncbi:flagellar hook-basal body protein [Paenibacillus sp. CGMCC 1.16610]|uniref:Flagellar hook-basal body complex protein n=1 Tax=Paenibacillus anseongense TaxID=2682845 RepID=A0ABW9U6P4_9BACL|nr:MULTISPECIES: flagellar hook-basal body protein [Paenibacillus]MBA2942439.1 flagellar hook-basal body protein [Paenibacillus sp. CGMCC 1.16610]MVQ34513.1 flagellar hook-basal body complex protein [Paenibacillus anseongense]